MQYDSYQCGAWCSFFVNVCVEYLRNYKNSVNKSKSAEFLNFFSSYLIEKKINCSNNLINVDIDFAKNLGKTCITEINQDPTENPALENKTLKADTGVQYFHEKFLAHLKFIVVSVDCQHTLWNGKEWQRVLSILRQKGYKNFLSYADTIYWKYDLADTIKKYIPKSATKEKLDITKKEQIDFFQSSLSGEVNITRDTYVAED